MELYRETVKYVANGHTLVGLVATQLSLTTYKINKGVLLRAPGAVDSISNTTAIWVGNQAVTNDSNPDTGGMPIIPGASLFIPIDDITLLYVIAGAVDQDIAWMVV